MIGSPLNGLNTKSEQDLILWDVLFWDIWRLCRNAMSRVKAANKADVTLCSDLILHSCKFHSSACREDQHIT